MGMAIKDMLVRGAPAIGIAGAFGVALGAQEISHITDKNDFLQKLKEIGEYLISTRPTAVNLSWAVNRQLDFAQSLEAKDINAIIKALIDNGIKMHDEDIEINKSHW